MFVKALMCDEDTNKICPHKAGIKINKDVVMTCSSSAYMGCCKCQDLLKQMDNFEDTL